MAYQNNICVYCDMPLNVRPGGYGRFSFFLYFPGGTCFREGRDLSFLGQFFFESVYQYYDLKQSLYYLSVKNCKDFNHNLFRWGKNISCIFTITDYPVGYKDLCFSLCLNLYSVANKCVMSLVLLGSATYNRVSWLTRYTNIILIDLCITYNLLVRKQS